MTNSQNYRSHNKINTMRTTNSPTKSDTLESPRSSFKPLSNQEKKWVLGLCDEISAIHFNTTTTSQIKHYCCIVPHGRSKRSREKGGFREEPIHQAVQHPHTSRRNRCIP